MKRFKNILFFADGSEKMTPALQRVVQLATSITERENAHLDIVHAWHLPRESMFRGGRFRMPVQELEAMRLEILGAIWQALQAQRLKLMVAHSNGLR